jgi:hypothetical protein
VVQAAELAERAGEPELAPERADQAAPVAAVVRERAVAAILRQRPADKAHRAAQAPQTQGRR